MGNKLNTVRVPFATRTTSLATATTLASATAHSFSATVDMPETTRTIRYVEIQVTCRDEFQSALDFDGARASVQINAVAATDHDQTVTVANTGDHTTFGVRFDATSYFVTNDPGTATFTANIDVKFATGGTSNVTGVTCLLIVTYQLDESAGTHVKSVAMPIQSHHTTISTSYVEVGTVSGTSNAPANQLAQLTSGGVLPESSITIKNDWIEITGMDNGAGTDLTLTIRVDGSTDVARFNCEQQLSSNVRYFDRYIMSVSATAAHAFECKSSAASTFNGIGAVRWVTYTYDPASTTIFNSLILPFEGSRGDPAQTTDSTAGDAERLQVVFDIQEPATITMKQSGFVLEHVMNNGNRLVLCSGQSARTYTEPSNSVRDGAAPIIMRGDHSSSTWTLARGQNRLTADVYITTEASNHNLQGAYAIINYTSGLSPQGCKSHNQTTVWPLVSYAETAGTARTNRTPTAPNLPETDWSLQGTLTDLWQFGTGGIAIQLLAERASGECAGAGWQQRLQIANGAVGAEVGSKRYFFDTTDWWRESSYSTDRERMALETSRDWVIYITTAYSASRLVTHHSNTFTVAGDVTVDGDPIADGETIDIYSVDANGLARLERSTTTSSGSFSVEVVDQSRTYHASMDDTYVGRSLGGTPETDSFDIAAFTGTGGLVPRPVGSPFVRRLQ